MRIVNVVSDEDTTVKDFESDLLHGTAVTLKLLQPWCDTSCDFCADSFFASVHTAGDHCAKGLRLTGVLQTSTTEYLMKYISHLEIAEKGEQVTLVSILGARSHLKAVA